LTIPVQHLWGRTLALQRYVRYENKLCSLPKAGQTATALDNLKTTNNITSNKMQGRWGSCLAQRKVPLIEQQLSPQQPWNATFNFLVERLMATSFKHWPNSNSTGSVNVSHPAMTSKVGR